MSHWAESFIVIAAVAIVIQMVILFMLFITVQRAVDRFTDIATKLQAKVDPILDRVNRIVDDSETRISSIMGDAAELTQLARMQAQKVDRVFTDTIERLRIQIVRLDHILTGALEVIEETGSSFRSKVWQPVNQFSAVLKGIRAGLDFFRGQDAKRPSPDPTTQDEELFI